MAQKTLYHSELAKCGAVEIEVKTDVLESKYKGKPPFVGIILNGEERNYNCENDACAGFFQGLQGLKGRKLTIEASGREAAAEIQEVDGVLAGPAKSAPRPQPAARPAAAARPAPTQAATPHEVTKPLKERLNDPAWGAFNLKEHLRKCIYAAKQITAAVDTLPDQSPEGRCEWYRIFFISVEKANLFGNLPTGDKPATTVATAWTEAQRPAAPKREPEAPPYDPGDLPPDDSSDVPF